jgi:hypothetical protein
VTRVAGTTDTGRDIDAILAILARRYDNLA